MRYWGFILLFFAAVCYCQTPNAPSSFTITQNPINLSIQGLHVVGNQILNINGQAVQLRGVDKSGLEYECLSATGTDYFDGPIDSASIAAMTAWGINIVRLTTNEDCWLGINGLPAFGSASSYQSQIVSYVNALNAANIAVIIALQWAAPGTIQASLTCAGPGTQFFPAPDADHASAYWASVANAFKGNASVIFDLYNEPWVNSGTGGDSAATASLLLNGGSITDCSAENPYTSVGWQSLVNTIRGTGATNIVDVPGPGFTDLLDQWVNYKPTDTLNPPQLAAAWHSYSVQTNNNQAAWVSVIQPVMATVPLMTEEIGENDCQDVYINPLMAWLDGMGGNYLAWAWNTYDCSSYPAVISDYTGTPTSFGIGFRNHLLALSGASIPSPPPVTFFSNTYPFGIAVGRSTSYTASDGTIYYPDVNNTNPGMTNDFQYFTAFSTGASISNTSDPTLYHTGRYGVFGQWSINVPNGNYTVTLGMAPLTTFTQTTVNNPATASIDNAGEFGADQQIPIGTTVASCVWSSFSGTNDSPYSTPATSCPADSSTAVPTVDAATTVSYTVSVYNQVLSIQTAASFGGGRQTMLNSIKVVQNAPATIPGTPTGVTATPGNAQVALAWNATSGATTYNVLRATGTKGFYSTIGIPSTNSYTDSGTSNFTQYCYLIEAASSAGASAPTSYVCATPSAVPGVPTGVTATPGNASVALSWNAVTGATSYNVRRSTTSGSGYTTVGTPGTNAYNDTSVTNGTTYYYVIQAVNSAGTSGNSSQVSATPSAPTTGTWTNVTPSGVNLTSSLDCGNYGTTNIGADSGNPGTIYAQFNCQGIWKSTDYGQTWNGPINTGTNGAVVGDCAGGITVSPATPGTPATIYEACIRGGSITTGASTSGTAVGIWVSTDGGVDWVSYNIAPLANGRQDVYPPIIDPYDRTHLIMAPHEPTVAPWIVESTNSGQTWTAVNTVSGMQESGGTPSAFFINTGTPSTTRTTILYVAQDTPYGTWRTTNDGSSWTQVDSATHSHGIEQIYQIPDTGTIFLPELYGTEGSGVLKSTDYGQTWSQVVNSYDSVVFATASNVYTGYGWACQVGPGCDVNPSFELAPLPAGTSWSSPGTPSAMNVGNGFGQVAVVNNGVNSIAVASMWGLGIWRYIEPAPATGTWINVTPPSIDLVDNLSCGNYGTKSVEADPYHPGYVYTTFMCQGIWVSSNYGQTWTGPVNTGANAALVQDCAGTIAVAPTSTTTYPVLYLSCIRGTGLGFWKSTNGGVDWTLENVAPAGAGSNQQFYAPIIDPYDSTHLIMAGHTTNAIYESTNSGVTWTSVNVVSGMQAGGGGTLGLEFVNTGNASTTRTTFLAASAACACSGTWRTTNDGTTWTHVSDNEHVTGEFQTYQPDTSGKVYMTGLYSASGYGVFYSTDYGQTWTHEGINQQEGIIVGTPNDLYAAYGFGVGPGGSAPPALEIAPPPGTGTWSSPGTPSAMTQGPAQGAVMNQGTYNVVLFANYNSGMWLYVEP